MVEMPRRNQLRELSLEVIITNEIRDPFKEGLRWSEIRNSIINLMSLELNHDDLNNFSVRLSRALEDNEKNGLINKIDEHQNVRYMLSEIEFPKYRNSQEINFNVELPPIFGLFGLLHKCNSFEDLKESFQDYIMISVEDKLIELWKQYKLISKYSFEDWGKVSDILESNDYTIDEKKEVRAFSNLMFKWMLYRREKLVMPLRENDNLN